MAKKKLTSEQFLNMNAEMVAAAKQLTLLADKVEGFSPEEVSSMRKLSEIFGNAAMRRNECSYLAKAEEMLKEYPSRNVSFGQMRNIIAAGIEALEMPEGDTFLKTAKPLKLFSEGTVVKLIARQGFFCRVELPSGHQGCWHARLFEAFLPPPSWTWNDDEDDDDDEDFKKKKKMRGSRKGPFEEEDD